MNVIAWSPNLTPEKCKEAGVGYATKEELFATADIVTIHVVLSQRSRGLVGAADLARMKPTAYLVNTARGPIVDEAALLDALVQKKIAGAGSTTAGCVPGMGASWACDGAGPPAAGPPGGGAAEAVVVPGGGPPGITTTRVPALVRSNRSDTSSFSMPMQPDETNLPIVEGWLVPWMR